MLTLYNGFILVKLSQDDKTAGGLSKLERQSDAPSTGNLVYFKEKKLSTGSRVWFKKWSGETIEYMGESLLAIPQEDLIAKEGGEDVK